MDRHNYFFVDGSSLIADIQTIQKRSTQSLTDKKLCTVKFVRTYAGSHLSHLHGNAFDRFVIYFAQNEPRIKKCIALPDFKKPEYYKDDISIEYCGKKLQKSSRVDYWLESKKAPNYIIERMHKSEKAVDTQICCDALQLAAVNRLDRLFLYTNDSDFVPLCKTLHSLGRNVSLISLTSDRINKDLVDACDSFSVAENIEHLFV